MAELLAIAFAFFIVGMLLTLTGFGEKLYGVERAQGSYLVEVFLGMASAAAFLHLTVFLKNSSLLGVAAQSILPIAFGYLALIVAMWTVGVGEVLIGYVSGKQPQLLLLLGTVILFVTCFALAFFQNSFLIPSAAWPMALIACLVGIIWVAVLSSYETNRIWVGGCFVVGFVIYGLVRSWAASGTLVAR